MLIVKQGDTKNAIYASLMKEGNPINLEGCKVYISISNGINKQECIIADAEKGEVYFPLEHRVTGKSGIYNYDFYVEYPDGRIEGFPNDRYLKLRIMQGV